jgi:UDPglucose 6-dehydrogenase
MGLWHLGSVTAACTAAAGHRVTGWDPDQTTVERLAAGEPPVAEHGLAELVREGLASGHLSFTIDIADAVRRADVVWITFDTPVDEEDRADTESVLDQASRVLPHLKAGALVLVSSQWPVGTTARLEARAAERTAVAFAYAPENLRLGKAIAVFQNPDRVVMGLRDPRSRAIVDELFAPITTRLEIMSVESAEMTKHAVNAFLAASVTFINELASLCEDVGADARDVERGLRTERRIGPLAYLSPGGAFAGGTLARDVEALRQLGNRLGRDTPFHDGVAASNRYHAGWAQRRLRRALGTIAGQRVAVWGLTYKPGTDTLRRSASVELCEWLAAEGADVHVHDPAVRALPPRLAAGLTRHADAIDAARGAAALVVATEWPVYREITSDALAAAMPAGCVIDANRFLGGTLGGDARFQLATVGQPER